MPNYSIFHDAPMQHLGQYYLAKAEDVPGRFEFNVALIKGQHPDPPVPVLPLQLETKRLPLDFVPIVNLGANLCSQRFVDTLRTLGVPFLAYAARVTDPHTGQPLPVEYCVWRPVTIRGAIDWERSQHVSHPILKRRTVSALVLTAACLQEGPPLFYDPTYSEWLIRNDIGEQLVRAGLTGFEFYPLTLPLYQRMLPGGRLVPGQPTPPGMH